MLSPTSLKALVSRCTTRGLLAAAALACMQLGALAVENHPVMPPEKEPAPWQRAGIEAALSDPAASVQLHALGYCKDKKWVVPFHFSTEQWLKWLASPDWEMQGQAAEAAGQLGAQMPPEVQRALARLQKNMNTQSWTRQVATEAIRKAGAGMLPEVQLEMVTVLDAPRFSFDQQIIASKALGELGAAMTPATQEALLSLMKNRQPTSAPAFHAADALAHLGTHMPPQVQDALLDPHGPAPLRYQAALAMGRMGQQMPAQAQEWMRAELRNPGDTHGYHLEAAAALTLLGPQMPPEAPQALLAEYDKAPPAGASEDARSSHRLRHERIADMLEQMGTQMPPAIQQGLLERFLKAAHPPQTPLPGKDDPTAMMESGPQAAELRILSAAGSHLSAEVLKAVLAEFESAAASDEVRLDIAESFLQPLATSGALPAEMQHALVACMQDGKAVLHARVLAGQVLGSLGAAASTEIAQALMALYEDRTADGSLRSSALEAMTRLGAGMPEEIVPVLAGIIKQAVEESAAPSGPREILEIPVESAVPGLGSLGPKMPQEVQDALLAAVQHSVGNAQTPWEAAYALAQMGDKLPPQTQQRLLALLDQPELSNRTRTAIHQTLGVSGIHPVSDAQVAGLLGKTYLAKTPLGEPDPELRFYLYLWLGRTPAHLQAVRWLGRTDTEPPLGDTPPQEVLGLVSRLWPHSAGADAGHAALRQAMARRTTPMIPALAKAGAMDEPTRKVLAALSTQLAEDTTADCATALREVQAALAADAKGR